MKKEGIEIVLLILLQGPCKQDSLMKKIHLAEAHWKSPILCTRQVPKIRPTEEPLCTKQYGKKRELTAV